MIKNSINKFTIMVVRLYFCFHNSGENPNKKGVCTQKVKIKMFVIAFIDFLVHSVFQ